MEKIEAFLAEGRRLADRATAAPWNTEPETLVGRVWISAFGLGQLFAPAGMSAPPTHGEVGRAQANAAFLVWLRNNHDRLEKLVRIQTEELRKAELLVGTLAVDKSHAVVEAGVRAALSSKFRGFAAVEERWARGDAT